MARTTRKAVVKEEETEVTSVVKQEVTTTEPEPINFKTGQKFPTPSPGNGDRVFYETLLKQKPSSEMAQEWCVMYGILDEKQAAKLYEQICKRKGKPVVLAASASSSSNNNSRGRASAAASSPQKQAGRKRKAVVEDDIEGDTGMGAGSAWEGSGTVGV